MSNARRVGSATPGSTLLLYLIFRLPLFHDQGDTPILILTDRSGGNQLDPIADLALIPFIMGL